MRTFKSTLLAIAISMHSFSVLSADPVTQTDIDNLQQQVDSLSSQLTALAIENSNLNSLLSQQGATVNNQQLQINALQTQNTVLETDIQALETELMDVEGNLTALSEAPVGTIVAWHKDMAGMPLLDEKWVVCDGQTILDPESTLYGQQTPDLVNDKYQQGKGLYLRGGTTSGLFNESTQLSDNGYRYGFASFARYYGVGVLDVYDAEDFNGNFYSETSRVQARFQVAAMTVSWIMKIK